MQQQQRRRRRWRWRRRRRLRWQYLRPGERATQTSLPRSAPFFLSCSSSSPPPLLLLPSSSSYLFLAPQVTHFVTMKGPLLSWAILQRFKPVENRTGCIGLGWVALHTGDGQMDLQHWRAALPFSTRLLSPSLPLLFPSSHHSLLSSSAPSYLPLLSPPLLPPLPSLHSLPPLYTPSPSSQLPSKPLPEGPAWSYRT